MHLKFLRTCFQICFVDLDSMDSNIYLAHKEAILAYTALGYQEKKVAIKKKSCFYLYWYTAEVLNLFQPVGTIEILTQHGCHGLFSSMQCCQSCILKNQ